MSDNQIIKGEKGNFQIHLGLIVLAGIFSCFSLYFILFAPYARYSLIVIMIVISLIAIFMSSYLGLLLYVALYVLPPQAIFWGFEGFRVSYMVALTTFISWFFECLRKHQRFVWTPQNFIVLLFLLSLLFSTYNAYYKDVAFEKLKEMSKFIVVYFLIINLTNTKNRFYYFVWTIVFFSSLHACKQSFLWTITGRGGELQGPGGAIEENNDYGAFLATVFPFAFYLFLYERSLVKKYWALMSFTGMLLALFYTLSRGAYLALPPILLAFLFRAKRKILSSFILCISVIVIAFCLPQTVKDEIITLKKPTEQATAQSRFQIWKKVRKIIKNHPLTGVGPDNLRYIIGPVAHNGYYQLTAESGVPALSLYILIILGSSWNLYRVRRMVPKNQWVRCMSYLLETGLCGYLVSNMFISNEDGEIFYMIAGLSVALKQIAMGELEQT